MRILLKFNNSNRFFSNSIIPTTELGNETLSNDVLNKQKNFLGLVLEKLKNGFNDKITYHHVNNSNSNTIFEKQLRDIYSLYSSNNTNNNRNNNRNNNTNNNINDETIKKNILRKIREQIDSFINFGTISSITIQFYKDNNNDNNNNNNNNNNTNNIIGGNKKEYIKLQNGGKRLIHYGKKGGKYYIKNSKKYYIKK